MTKEQAKKLLPAIQHFAEGGELWHAMTEEKWFKQEELNVRTNSLTENIIKDKHFEARKAIALGQPIELFYNGIWITLEDMSFPPSWDQTWDYRPKQSEPEYECQYTFQEDEAYIMTKKYYIESEVVSGWTKFEPSKRLRK